MIARCWPTIGLALALLATSPSSSGADVDPLAGLRACVAEQDDRNRLVCFDREIAAAEPQASATAAPLEYAGEQSTAEDRFGYRGRVAREEMDRQKAENPGIEQLEAAVAGIVSQPHGELVITLDNGQVWAQLAPDRRFRLKVGDAVKVRPAALGSFLLSGPAGPATRVTRLQ